MALHYQALLDSLAVENVVSDSLFPALITRYQVPSMAFALHRTRVPRGLHPPVPETPDETPDGGYGWVCVVTCFTINCFTWGVVAVGQINFLSIAASSMLGGYVLSR